jgi:hypothetical protein
LSLIAYNLGNLWRRLVLPRKIGNWSLTSLQQRLVKTGGRLVKHTRYYWLVLAESHLTRRLFAGMVRQMDALATGRRDAMTQQNQADQGWRPDRCFWKCLKRRDFPVSGFSGGGRIGAWPSQKAAFGERVPKDSNSGIGNWRPVINWPKTGVQNGNPGLLP